MTTDPGDNMRRIAAMAFETSHGTTLEDSPRVSLNQGFDFLVQALQQIRHLGHLRLRIGDHAESMEVLAETERTPERRLAAAEAANLWRAFELVVKSVDAQRADALANRKDVI